MNEHARRSAVLVLAVVAVSATLLGRGERLPHTARDSDFATALLAATAPQGFERALERRELRFPRDHAAHPRFRTEWWYFTGHLEADDGARFGFQLTLFRFELDAARQPSPSAWRTPRTFMGHFAVSDLGRGEFHAFERLARAHPALAGASDTPIAVWIDDWRIEHDAASDAWHLHAASPSLALELDLAPASAVVVHGEGGLSHKSGTPGNASYYYSIPRLAARGSLELGERRLAVGGSAWLDREWSTSALDRDQQGWDWFALQFDDGANLMFYRLRRLDGSTDANSAGSWMAADGSVTALGADDVEIDVTERWTSPATGIVYPQQWRLEIPRLDVALTLRAYFPAQEWHDRFRYWEGVVAVDGSRRGRGYVEMTGYPVSLR